MLPKYTVFGNTVNVASRMQSTSQDMKIQCSESTFRLLSNSQLHKYSFIERRDGDSFGVQCKGKGVMLTWWLNCVYPLVRHSATTDTVSHSDDQ